MTFSAHKWKWVSRRFYFLAMPFIHSFIYFKKITFNGNEKKCSLKKLSMSRIAALLRIWHPFPSPLPMLFQTEKDEREREKWNPLNEIKSKQTFLKSTSRSHRLQPGSAYNHSNIVRINDVGVEAKTKKWKKQQRHKTVGKTLSLVFYELGLAS